MDQKMKDVVLNCTDKHQHGKIIIVPNAGEIQLDAEGNFTIDDVTASLLLNHGSGFVLIKGNGTTVPDNKEVKLDDSEDLDDDTKEEEAEEPDGLDELKLSELIDLAVKAEYPEEDYTKFMKSKKLMINYLRKAAK